MKTPAEREPFEASNHRGYNDEIDLINEAIASGDAALTAHAISTVAWARGVADQAFVADACPSIGAVVKMLDVLGLELRVVPRTSILG